MAHRPIVLIVRDGWGTNPHPDLDPFNAVLNAATPVADHLAQAWPTTEVKTCCEDVGLPPGTMGNSEVGHQNIGAGRVVPQELMRINQAIEAGELAGRPAIQATLDHVHATGGRIHLLGLLSDGCVHSDHRHLWALLEALDDVSIPGDRIHVHVITDGRDVGPRSSKTYIDALHAHLDDGARGRIATVCGRYWIMDRDHRWERVARAYQMLTGAAVSQEDLDRVPAVATASSASEAVDACYRQQGTGTLQGDEFITPTRILDPETGEPMPPITDGDAVIFFNYRGDRPRELTMAFMLPEEAWREVPRGGFHRGKVLDNLFFATMTRYQEGLDVSGVVFDKPKALPSILGDVVSSSGGTQFRCAETEKFPHVTFFFNDYREDPFPGETRFLAPSPTDVATYDQRPEMSAAEVCEAVLERVAADPAPDLIIVNFANGDMVGHTGNLKATIKAIEVVDACVGRIVDAVLQRGGGLIITADHGNAEQMWDPETNGPHTKHTTYTVPLHIVGDEWKNVSLREGGRLADIAPTALAMLGLDQPPEMTGRSLLEN